MKTRTCIYHKDELIRQEMPSTLAEFVAMGRLKSGQGILIGEVKEDNHNEFNSNTEFIWVGDCTPFHEPSKDDGEIGWNNDNPRMKKIVLEIHTFFGSKP